MGVEKKDWRLIMAELRAAGCTPYKVAIILGCSHCAAQNWEKGGEPGWAYGNALLQLHIKLTTTLNIEETT